MRDKPDFCQIALFGKEHSQSHAWLFRDYSQMNQRAVAARSYPDCKYKLQLL